MISINMAIAVSPESTPRSNGEPPMANKLLNTAMLKTRSHATRKGKPVSYFLAGASIIYQSIRA
ncbi:hypothetical protein SQ11_05135 [Nitrosospira sp. NpAV]|nr:hypothetical protein SQ11_05135 [Nitrosospira sp. NpAV]